MSNKSFHYVSAKALIRETCRLCRSRALEIVIPMENTPVAEKLLESPEDAADVVFHPLDVFICQSCGHVQLLHIIDPELLYRDFNYRSAGTKALIDHFDATAADVAFRFKFGSNPLAVDIGSNDGSLLKCFKNRGFRVLGVDPAIEIAQEATAAGIPTQADFVTSEVVEKIVFEQGHASVVCAFNVFAHTNDLEGMTICIQQLLAPDGIFVFECSYLRDILNKMLLGTIFHEHLSHHSITPLWQFLGRLGLELIDVVHNQIQGGSIVGIAQLKGGPHHVMQSVSEFLLIERDEKLLEPATVRRFSERLSFTRDRLSAFVASQLAIGKRFWGFGSARSGTTLITQLRLGRVIENIVDDNPDKQYKFAPPFGTPIVPTASLYSEKPDYIFILAWIHTESILERHKHYLDLGGRFIVCFPELKIIGKNGSNMI